MNDRKIIYLDDAIEAIRASTKKYTGFMEMEMYTDDDAVEAIINLPPAQPQRAKGKWITEEENYIKQIRCSECGKNALRVFVADDHYGNCIHGEVKTTNFCPNCGADMRDEENDT